MVGCPLVPSHMVWGRREVHDIWWDVLSYQATWFGGGGRCMTYGGMYVVGCALCEVAHPSEIKVT